MGAVQRELGLHSGILQTIKGNLRGTQGYIRRGLRGTRGALVGAHRPDWRALAAGVTWTSRTLKAEWAARAWHTTVVDAAGAIYIIGGDQGGTILFQDVCVSTDGGALTGLHQRGGTRGGTTGVCRGV